MTCRHPAYAKAARAASTEIRRAKRSFERRLAEKIDSDRKSFYAYVRSRSKARSTAGPLLDNHTGATTAPDALAEKFNEYFASVFTVEDSSSKLTAEWLKNIYYAFVHPYILYGIEIYANTFGII